MEKYFCKQCGKEIEKGVPTCPYCGAAMGPVIGQIETTAQTQGIRTNDMTNKTQAFYANDNGSFVWILVGLFLPPIGILLYLLKRRTSRHAKSALIASVISLCLILAIVLSVMNGKRKSPYYPNWQDYSNLLGADRQMVLNELERDGEWGTRIENGGYVLQKREEIEKSHSFTVTFWFASDSHLTGITKEYTGRINNVQDFVPGFYKEMVKFYGKPDQPPAGFQYENWEQFYDGMVVMTVDGKEERSLTAIWREKNVMVDFKTHNGQFTITYSLFNKADWPANLQ